MCLTFRDDLGTIGIMDTKTNGEPIEVKRGNVIVKIYQGINRVNGVEYPQFTLTYYEGAERKKRRFADLAEARREAEFTADRLSKGEGQVLNLTSVDRQIYVQAVECLRPLHVPLNIAVQEYVSAVKQLPTGATLKEAVVFFRKRNTASLEKRSVRQVTDELVAAKRAAKLSEVYLWDLQVRLNRFSNAFQMDIGNVSGTMLQTWLDNMEGSGRTKRNYLAVIAALFRFAIRRKYLPKDSMEEIEAVQPAKEDNGEIEIFSPIEMEELLTAVRPEIRPWLAIAGFAGLRSAELQRLDWKEVNLKERHIEIKARKAKTAARRLAPITGNLAAWLRPHEKESSKVTSQEEWWEEIPDIVKTVNDRRKHLAEQAGKTFTDEQKFSWKHNALRHSFISYRLAAIKNAAEVALEAGNSPQMIFKHYRQLVTEAEAKKWFGITPEKNSDRRKAA